MLRIDRPLLEAALVGLEIQKQKIAEKMAEIERQLDGARPVAASAEQPKPKRRLSSAARKRIAAAQRKRWQAARQKAAEMERQQAEAKAKRVAALAKARKILAAKRKSVARKKALTASATA